MTDVWKVFRFVLASGSSPLWSPLTPGFSQYLQEITAIFPLRETDLERPRVLGLAKLEHPGEPQLYRVVYKQWESPGARISLVADSEALPADLLQHAGLPRVFQQTVSASQATRQFAPVFHHDASRGERQAIDQAFADMADDLEYQAESNQLTNEFAAADAEAFRLGEAS
jgi:hypothetical protein